MHGALSSLRTNSLHFDHYSTYSLLYTPEHDAAPRAYYDYSIYSFYEYASSPDQATTSSSALDECPHTRHAITEGNYCAVGG